MSKFQVEYYTEIIKLIKKIQKNQNNKIIKTANLIKKSYLEGGMLYLFGTGHDRKSTRLNSSHANISYAVFCLKKKKKK